MAFQQCLIDSEAILKKNMVNTETEEWLLTTLVYPTKEPSHYKNILVLLVSQFTPLSSINKEAHHICWGLRDILSDAGCRACPSHHTQSWCYKEHDQVSSHVLHLCTGPLDHINSCATLPTHHFTGHKVACSAGLSHKHR